MNSNVYQTKSINVWEYFQFMENFAKLLFGDGKRFKIVNICFIIEIVS